MVKRYSHLYPHITTFENLCTAYRRAAAERKRSDSKRGQPNVAAFEFNLEPYGFPEGKQPKRGVYV